MTVNCTQSSSYSAFTNPRTLPDRKCRKRSYIEIFDSEEIDDNIEIVPSLSSASNFKSNESLILKEIKVEEFSFFEPEHISLKNKIISTFNDEKLDNFKLFHCMNSILEIKDYNLLSPEQIDFLKEIQKEMSSDEKLSSRIDAFIENNRMFFYRTKNKWSLFEYGLYKGMKKHLSQYRGYCLKEVDRKLSKEHIDNKNLLHIALDLINPKLDFAELFIECGADVFNIKGKESNLTAYELAWLGDYKGIIHVMQKRPEFDKTRPNPMTTQEFFEGCFSDSLECVEVIDPDL